MVVFGSKPKPALIEQGLGSGTTLHFAPVYTHKKGRNCMGNRALNLLLLLRWGWM